MDTTLFGRLGGFAVRRRWFVIATWAVLLVTMGTFARGLSGRLTSGGFEVPGSPSLAVQHDLQNRFSGQYPYTALVVVMTAPLLAVNDRPTMLLPETASVASLAGEIFTMPRFPARDAAT